MTLLTSLHKFVLQQNIPDPTSSSGTQDLYGPRITFCSGDQSFYFTQMIDIKLSEKIYSQHMKSLRYRVQFFVRH